MIGKKKKEKNEAWSIAEKTIMTIRQDAVMDFLWILSGNVRNMETLNIITKSLEEFVKKEHSK